MELVARPPAPLPAECERQKKYQQINREPRLHRRHREMRPAQQVFVVKRTHRAEQRPGDDESHPFVAMEMHAFAPTGKRKPDKRNQRGDDAQGFQQGWTFAQNQQRTKQRPQRAGRPDGRAERQRQILERKIGKNPRRGDNDGLELQLQVLLERERIGNERYRQNAGVNCLHTQ